MTIFVIKVELMFSFEEFFKGEDVFNQSLHWGHMLGPLIPNICDLLYDQDVVTEDAFLVWSSEKENATDPEDLLFYNKARQHQKLLSVVRPFISGEEVCRVAQRS